MRGDGTVVWLAQVRPAGFKPINKTFESRSEAERFAREEEAKAVEARRAGALLSSSSFYDEKVRHAIELFMAREGAKSSEKSSLTAARKHFENVTFGELRPSIVKAYVDKMLRTKSRLGRPFSCEAVAHQMQHLRSVYRWRALAYDVTAKPDVFSTQHLPRGWQVRRERRLDPMEERAIFAELRRRGRKGYAWRLMIKLALETAARLQELVLAEWSEFDLNRRVWSMPAGHTKGNRARSVPLSKRAVRVMKALRKQSKPGQLRPFATIAKPNLASVTFRKITSKAKVVGLRFHDLRHESVSRLVLEKRKLSVFEIMKIVGHSSPEMLARYANLRGDELVDRMD